MRYPANVASLLDQLGLGHTDEATGDSPPAPASPDQPGEPDTDAEAPPEGPSSDADPRGSVVVEADAQPDGETAHADADGDSERTPRGGGASASDDIDAEAEAAETAEAPAESEDDAVDDDLGIGSFDLDDLEESPDGDAPGPGEGDNGVSTAGDERDQDDERRLISPISERNERIESYSRSTDHTEIRARVRETGVAERIQNRLEDLFTGNRRPQAQSIREERDETGLVGGHYDMRQVVRRFAGDTRVRELFHSPSPALNDDVAVGIVLDLSGSMGGQPQYRAKEAAGAFLFSIQLFGGEVMAVGYPGKKTEADLITAPREPFRWRHLDATTAGGGTPTSDGIRAGREQLESVTADTKLMLVLTDGGARSMEQTRHLVDELRDRRDWAVVGFGFGDIAEYQLSAQFGEHGYRAVDLEDLAGALYDVFEQQVRT